MSGDVPHSPGFSISHSLAAVETAHLNQEKITPDLSICGITKLEDFQSPDILRKIGLSPRMVPSFLAEAQQLLQLFKDTGLKPREIRHVLRERIGDGGYHRNKGEHISRSDEVRAAFDRASDIAAEHSAQIVMVQHLLAALLEIDGTHIRDLLAEQGIDVDELREKAAALPVTASKRHTSTDLLDQLGTDLTAQALAGELSPVVGRKSEMLKVIKTLGRNKKNCPVLVGAAGVGKTAIAEGLAQRIAVKNIHQDFHDKRIIQLNASSLVAGTTYRGQFEERIEQLIMELAGASDVILFVDEIHLLVGAGASGGGGMDAANILKPALADGKIKLIGATTDAEYRQYIKKDAALERRFEPVRVAEPTKRETVEMLTGARDHLQETHGVTIMDDAIFAAVELSVRYITDRFLPDKAYTLLDTACADARYGSMLSLRPDNVMPNQPLNAVTEETIKAVLVDMGAMPSQEQDLSVMAETLKQRIVGQDDAVDAVTQIVQRHYAGMSDPQRPVGVFLFAGPTGVGKTELARATADFLFFDDKRLIRLDMSEYMEKHNVSRLIGAPPGYTGYEQGGQLTNALRDKGQVVVLIDEIEKAHPDVLNIFLGLFDNGRLTDGQGRTVDAQNALFIMTSNLGYSNANTTPTPDEVKNAVYAHLRPEFINRIDALVYFQPLQQQHMERLVEIQFTQLERQLDGHIVSLKVDAEAITWLAEHGYDPQMGARALLRLFRDEVTTRAAQMLLAGELTAGETAHVYIHDDHIDVKRLTNPTQNPLENKS